MGEIMAFMDPSTACVVYRLTSPSGKKYIGISTLGVARRISYHKDQAGCINRKYLIHVAIAKYGLENFVVEEVLRGTLEECRNMEIRLIREEHTRAPEGYNCTDGGDGCRGLTVSDATKEKLRVANLGKKQSIETIEKRRISTTGKKRSAEFCANLGDRMRGRQKSEQERINLREGGKKRAADPVERARLLFMVCHPTDATKEKMRLAKIGRKPSEETLKKRSTSLKKTWEDPQRRATMSARVKAQWAERKAKGLSWAS
jgi:group I intron endonuclease